MLFTQAFEEPVEVIQNGKFITIPLAKYYNGQKLKGMLGNEYIVTRGYSWTLPGKGKPEVTIKLSN
jgi:hypothetical protein